MLDHLFGFRDVFSKSSGILPYVVFNLCKLHARRGQRLPRAIVQLPCYVAPLHVLRLQELPRKVAQLCVSFLKFLSTELYLGVERIRQCSITFFTLSQSLVNPFTLGDVPGNFRRSDNLPAGVPDGRDGERNIEQCLIFSDTNGVEG